MSVSVATMGLTEMAQYLVATGTFSTLAEAIAALNIVIVDDVAAVTTGLTVVGGPAEMVVGTLGETALDVAARAALEAGATQVKTGGVGVIVKGGEIAPTALLGVDLGVIGAVAAPLLGVGLGINLYESNPELWTKISQRLLPFCYPGTTKIPTWAEIANDIWQASISKKILDALKSLFQEEGILDEEGHVVVDATATSDLNTYPLQQPIGLGSSIHIEAGRRGGVVPSDVYDVSGATLTGTITAIGAGLRWNYVAASATSGTVITQVTQNRASGGEIVNNIELSNTYTYDGKTVYYAYGGSSFIEVPVLNYTGPLVDYIYNLSTKTAEIAWTIIYGNIHDAGLPEGIYEYPNPPSPMPEAAPSIIGIDSTTGSPITQPMVPIAPPFPIIIIPEPEVEPQPELIPFPWPEPTVEPHTKPWPTEMPWPLPADRPEWWPIEIPYPGTLPLPQPSPDPEIEPDPIVITQPEEQIEPWIMPLPLPWELPTPVQEPDPDPEIDPTKPRPPSKDVPPSRIIDIIPGPPAPTGVTPWPSMPTTPSWFDSDIGMITVYHPTPAQLYSFCRWLWVTLSQATIQTVWNNPFDGVITLYELYCTPTDNGHRTIHSGFLDSGIDSATISRYTEIDCGTIGIPEYYGNYFDYSPYSKAHIYLPFIGIQDLNVDDIVGHAVNVTYRIDEYNGSCIAMITVAKVTEVNGEDVEYSNTMYQFSGNCSVELPISGGSQAQIKAGLMMADATRQAALIAAGANLLGGLGSLLNLNLGGLLGGIGGAAATLAQGEVSALGHMLSGKSTVQKSGSFGSSHGALGIKTPFIVITRPKQIVVPNYNELYGYPSHKMVYVGDCTGFLRCREVHVVSPTANDDEKTMIENLLKSGVYVTE